MPNYQFRIRVEVKTPVLTRSSRVGAYGVDAPFARDAEDHHIIPGTLIEGCLREAWAELAELGIMDSVRSASLRGVKSTDGQWTPARGMLVIGDLVREDTDSGAPGLQTRIKIDPKRGAVAKGAMLVSESLAASGATLSFLGVANLWADDDAGAREARTLIKMGLQWTPRIGGNRSIGFGRLTGVNVSVPVQRVVPETSPSVTGDVFWIALRPVTAFCVAQRRRTPHLFESDDRIPGGAIKGALISSIYGPGSQGSGDLLAKHIGRIRFSHAFPTADISRRPVVPPLSLAQDTSPDGVSDVFDVVHCKEAALINGYAPAFNEDWKIQRKVDKLFGWPDAIRRELRVHTAIDSEKRRHAEKQLFAYESVVPDELVWLARVDCSGVQDDVRPDVRDMLLRKLCAGFAYLGKTKTEVEVTVLKPADVSAAVCSSPDGPVPGKNSPTWVITLQTPALLCDPQWNSASGHSQRSQEWLHEAYESAIAQMSNDVLSLSHFFADQTLSGGYVTLRFKKDSDPYYPYLLTREGSVFVVTSRKEQEEAAGGVLARWLCNGLPLPKWASARYGASWRDCPYIPENGYGEITVNLDCHDEWCSGRCNGDRASAKSIS